MLIVVKHIRDTNPKSCIVKLLDYRLCLEDNQDTLFCRKLESEFADVDSVECTSLLMLPVVEHLFENVRYRSRLDLALFKAGQ